MANRQAFAVQKLSSPSSRLPRKASLLNRDECEIYFLAGGDLIKIGITTNMTSRMRAIRNSSPVPLELLARGPGCTFTEMRIHAKFAHLRRHGEWFKDEGSIRQYVAENFGPETPRQRSRGLTNIAWRCEHGLR
jgi:hypothetical protein